MLQARISKIQMPSLKMMNRVPDRMLQQIFKDQKAYMPVAVTTSPRKPSPTALLLAPKASAKASPMILNLKPTQEEPKQSAHG